MIHVSWIQVGLHQLDVVSHAYSASCCLRLQQTNRKKQDGAREGRGNEVTHYRDLRISNTLSYYFTT